MVAGRTDAADPPVGEPVAGVLLVGELAVGEPGVGEAAPLSSPDTPRDTSPATCVAAVVAAGRSDWLACSRRRWLQRESASAITSRSAANRPQGSWRAG